MKKQMRQFGVIACILLVCIIGYFVINNQFAKAEKDKESADKIVAFTLHDYKEIKEISYVHENKVIKLKQENKKWSILGDEKAKIDSDVVEKEMLSKLVEVIAKEKIESVSHEEDYGFIKSDDEMAASTNTIRIVDKDEKELVVYIGNANPYDESLYYMMVKGDENVYVISSDIVDGFSKSVEDIEEETTTMEETTTTNHEK